MRKFSVDIFDIIQFILLGWLAGILTAGFFEGRF